MPSPKQIALADLMHWLICVDRGPQTVGPINRLFGGKMYKRVFEDLNLIHRIPHSILEPEYTENDISFINYGIQNYLDALGASVDGRVAHNLLVIVDGAPEELRGDIEWVAPDWLKEKAEVYRSMNKNLS